MRHRWFCIANANFYKFYGDTLWSYEQKRLNRSICRLGCGLGYAEGSISSIVFARWRQCVLMGGHIATTVVERRSLAGELSLSCAQPAADG